MVKKVFFTLFFLLTAYHLPLTAGVDSGADFLKLGIGERASALGETGVALAGDLFSSYWNPAGLSKVKKAQLGVTYTETVMEAKDQFLGLVYPVRTGVFGLSGIFFTPEAIPVTDGSGKIIGEAKWLDYTITLSYAKEVFRGFSAGLNLKLVRREESDPIFGKAKGSAYAGEIGLLYETPLKGLNLGFALLNFGNKLQMSGETKKDDLPKTYRVGFAYQLRLNPANSLTLTVEMNKILQSPWRSGFGAEFGLLDLAFLRAGYLNKEGNISGITYGGGIRISSYEFNYANIPSSQMIGYERANSLSILICF